MEAANPSPPPPSRRWFKVNKEEAWKRTRVGGSAPLTDFPPADPFADAPSRGPITVIHSRKHGTILLRTTGTYRRNRPIFAETPNHTFPPPLLRRITVSSFGREKGKRGARGRREGWIRGTDEENGRSEIVDEDARNDPRA